MKNPPTNPEAPRWSAMKKEALVSEDLVALRALSTSHEAD
jgi:hypothetical protein